jgi:hypothetical protein
MDHHVPHVWSCHLETSALLAAPLLLHYYAAPNNKKKGRRKEHTHTHIYTVARERQHKRRLCEKRKEKKTVHCIDDMCGRERGGNIRASQQRRLVEMAITTHASLIQ